MKPTLRFSFFFALVFSFVNVFAQSNNIANVWTFGYNAGLDFNSGSPVPILYNPMTTNEGCSSICDRNTGQILFYTDGTYIWDRNNAYMPATSFGSIPLGGDPSATQSAICIPKPGTTNLYYVFTVDAQCGLFSGGSGGVQYSVVDMNLNGGFGDIVPGAFPTLLLANTTEKISAVSHCNGQDVWIMIHKYGTNQFYAYLLTAAGLSAPVISSVGLVHTGGSGQNAESIGYLKFSPDGKKIALACYQNMNRVQIFDFDNFTGVVSNPITDTNFPLTGSDGPYGVSFSPNGSRLYVSSFGPTPGRVFQYNMLAGTGAQIIASRTLVASENNYGMGGIQCGPDGKMYVAKSNNNSFTFGSDSIDVITNPNALGVACGYQVNGQYLGGAGINQSFWGLAAFVEDFLTQQVSATMTYTSCNGNSTFTFNDSTLNGNINYHWNFGDPTTGANDSSNLQFPTHTFSGAGNFNVTLIMSSPCGVDTFTTVIVSNAVPVLPSLGADVTICPGDSVLLSCANAPPGSTYSWTPTTGLGSSTSQSTNASPAVVTTYIVTATAPSGCSGKDTIVVNISAVLIATAKPDTSICPGQTVQLNATGGTTYSWAPIIGLSNANIPNPLATPPVTTVYTVTVSSGTCAPVTASATVTLLPLPLVDAGNDVIIQAGGSTQLLATGTSITYTWTPPMSLDNANIPNPVANPLLDIIYTVTGTDANGCVNTDDVAIHVENFPFIHYPNVFTPNGDGINDLFLAHFYEISALDIKIFNRWGQWVYEGNKPEVGWDGTHDGLPAEIGTYVFTVAATGIDGKQISQKGNVTLIR